MNRPPSFVLPARDGVTEHRSLIAGIGEMAARIRHYDWSRHPLGPLESWSGTLLATVTTCLSSPAPMQLWWGTSSIMFYNDAFIPWVGDAHSTALGRRAVDVYGPRWQRFRTLVQRVFVDGTVVEDSGTILTPVSSGSTVEGILCTFARQDVEDALGFARRALDECVMHASASGNELECRIHELADRARLSNGSLAPNRRPESVRTLADDAVRVLESLHARSGQIVVDVPPTLVVSADGPILTRALATLLRRVLQSSHGEVTRISAEQVGDLVRVVVAPAAHVETLDLTAMQLIELHHGHCLQEAGRLVVELPALRDAQTSPAAARPRRVLVVDDDEASARVMQFALQQLGHRVAIAHDAPIAVSIARVFVPELAIVDIQLPVIDGWALAPLLRAAAGDIPLVALTGFTELDRSRSLDSGFVEHFLKPVSIERLDRCISMLLSA